MNVQPYVALSIGPVAAACQSLEAGRAPDARPAVGIVTLHLKSCDVRTEL